MKTENDGKLIISTGESRTSFTWENREILWSDLLDRLSACVLTQETAEQYRQMSNDERLRAKDVGGYVGGRLLGGKRSNAAVSERWLLTLDADNAGLAMEANLYNKFQFAWAMHTTHSHRSGNPRMRIVIPLSHGVSPDQFGALSRWAASELGLMYIDDDSHQISQVMFWPSRSQDSPFTFRFRDLPFLDPDSVLASLQDWHNILTWPDVHEPDGEGHIPLRTAHRHLKDPTEKKGLIGAFCRAYTVQEVIDKYLPEKYIKTDKPNVYTLAECDTVNGLVVYDGGRFVRSYHPSDPVAGRLCNVYDLVRLHLFPPRVEGDLASETNSGNDMRRMIAEDPLTVCEKVQGLRDLADKTPELPVELPNAWHTKLKFTQEGELKKTEQNCELILENDQCLKGIVFNEFSGFREIRDDIAKVPWSHPFREWRDEDDAQLLSWLEKHYTSFSGASYKTSITKVTDDRRYHPVKEYLESLPAWDGVKRVETLLIDYLGAQDRFYTRAVTRKMLCAAVRRIYQPGYKFDNMVVMVGPQGSGKSTLLSRLGGEWFSDSLSLNDIKDKTGAEKLQGTWILEIGEMSGIRNAEVENVRAFISRQDDQFRVSYGHHVTKHPRQCVFFGTTNEESGFLQDVAGNRRFWPVHCPGKSEKKSWDLTEETIGQIWAEAMILEKNESLVLEGELAEFAEQEQRLYLQGDEREGLVQRYLDMPLPLFWDRMSTSERAAYFRGERYTARFNTDTVYRRKYVCAAEIWCEAFGESEGRITLRDSKDIFRILSKLGWEKPEGNTAGTMEVPIYGRARVRVRPGVKTLREATEAPVLMPAAQKPADETENLPENPCQTIMDSNGNITIMLEPT